MLTGSDDHHAPGPPDTNGVEPGSGWSTGPGSALRLLLGRGRRRLVGRCGGLGLGGGGVAARAATDVADSDAAKRVKRLRRVGDRDPDWDGTPRLRDLGRRLARVADALVLVGRTPEAGAVLRVDERGDASLISMPELVGADPATVLVRLRERLGDCAVLCCGPAGEREVPFANLAAGGRTPHFVGRGGLGARDVGLRGRSHRGDDHDRYDRDRAKRSSALALHGTHPRLGCGAT